MDCSSNPGVLLEVSVGTHLHSRRTRGELQLCIALLFKNLEAINGSKVTPLLRSRLWSGSSTCQYKIVCNRMKSNHAFLILCPHKKGLIMAPRGRPCASTFPIHETGIRPIFAMQSVNTGMFLSWPVVDYVLLHLIAVSGSEGLCCCFGEKPKAWLLTANPFQKMSAVSSCFQSCRLIFKVHLPCLYSTFF